MRAQIYNESFHNATFAVQKSAFLHILKISLYADIVNM